MFLGFRFLFASNSSRLPLQSPQIEEFGPSHLSSAQDIDPVDPGGMGWKDPLHSYPIRDLSHSEGGANSPFFLSDYHPFKKLDSFLLPLDDFHMNSDRIAHPEIGQVCSQLLSFNYLHGIHLTLLPDVSSEFGVLSSE